MVIIGYGDKNGKVHKKNIPQCTSYIDRANCVRIMVSSTRKMVVTIIYHDSFGLVQFKFSF